MFSQIKPTKPSLFVYFVFFFNAFVSLDTSDEILISPVIVYVIRYYDFVVYFNFLAKEKAYHYH